MGRSALGRKYHSRKFSVEPDLFYERLRWDGSDEDVRRAVNHALLRYRKRPLEPGAKPAQDDRETYAIWWTVRWEGGGRCDEVPPPRYMRDEWAQTGALPRYYVNGANRLPLLWDRADWLPSACR
ncbi:hypothetical protein [Actinomadura atramentaria]|uniref:hypothetical protein n=1 Tax=Actinomadura atramentaria TaxID=1990 RepID=UPI001469F450|nr:hypothetical protein [Actinomadura atramentaria]